MTMDWQHQLQSQARLREIVQQATASLVAMDAERLEELAQCCADLNREIQKTSQSGSSDVAEGNAFDGKSDDTAYDLQLFEHILFETRANLAVFSRLHVMRLHEAGLLLEGAMPYGPNGLDALRSRSESEVAGRDVDYGDN